MVLVGCESSGVVRRAFRALGHDAWSCDLLPADDGAEHHLQTDVLKAAGQRPWDLGIFHPPCTYLSVSGLHWNKTRPERAGLTAKALDLVRALLELALPRLALENPIGCISSKIRRPSQIIQPHDFGEDASKATCLWLRGLPPLVPTKRFPPRIVEWPPGSGKMRQRWGNQTDSGQNKLPPSDDRWKLRSKTYDGIAAAMASQWGGAE